MPWKCHKASVKIFSLFNFVLSVFSIFFGRFLKISSLVFPTFTKIINGDTELLSLHAVQTLNIELEKEKYSVVCGSLPIEQAHDDHCMSDRSQNAAGFVIWVVLTPTKDKFLWAVNEWRICSTCRPITTRWSWREKVCVSRWSQQKKKHTQEMRVTKLTSNQTACPRFQQQHGRVCGTTLCD